jgi:transcriptional regulator with XRE-family HTH domain
MTDAESSTLGHVRRLLWLKHMSQAELARRSGLSVDAVSRLFRGQRRLNVNELDAFAKALEVPKEALLTGDFTVDLTAEIEKAAV